MICVCSQVGVRPPSASTVQGFSLTGSSFLYDFRKKKVTKCKMLVLEYYLELEAHISQQTWSGSKYWKFGLSVNSIAAVLPIWPRLRAYWPSTSIDRSCQYYCNLNFRDSLELNLKNRITESVPLHKLMRYCNNRVHVSDNYFNWYVETS